MFSAALHARVRILLPIAHETAGNASVALPCMNRAAPTKERSLRCKHLLDICLHDLAGCRISKQL